MKNSIKFISIDDQRLDSLMIETYAKLHPSLLHCGSFSNAGEAIAAIEAIQPNVVFLDIEMPGLSGLELLRNIKSKIEIAIFVTSHPEFALEGFELSALDYILKPLTEERLALCVKRIEEYWQMKQQSDAYEVLFENDMLTFKEGYNIIKIPTQEIIYLEAMQDYTKVVTTNKKYLTLSTLTGFLHKLSEEKMVRTHRSFAVALEKITGFANSQIACGNHSVPVGKTYRSIVNKLISQQQFLQLNVK